MEKAAILYPITLKKVTIYQVLVLIEQVLPAYKLHLATSLHGNYFSPNKSTIEKDLSILEDLVEKLFKKAAGMKPNTKSKITLKRYYAITLSQAIDYFSITPVNAESQSIASNIAEQINPKLI